MHMLSLCYTLIQNTAYLRFWLPWRMLTMRTKMLMKLFRAAID